MFSFDLANPTSLTSMLHSLFGVLGFLAMVFVPFVATLSFKRDGKWENLYSYTTATGIVFLLLLLLFIGILPSFGVSIPSGLGQRIGFGIWYLWMAAVGMRVVRLSKV